MPINKITAHRLALARQSKQIREVLQKPTTTPVYYEIHSGIMDYRTGSWITHDPVDIVQTRTSAREELTWRNKHPTTNQNTAYIVRRYRHGNQNTTETMENVC